MIGLQAQLLRAQAKAALDLLLGGPEYLDNWLQNCSYNPLVRSESRVRQAIFA